MTERRVAIIGGGWAGLSAAVTLADAGCRAIVFETARLLGGRARRVEFDEREVDNGLHILLGAYRQTLAVIDKVGASAGLLRLPLQLHIADRFDLACPRWPAPLHLIAGLLGARGLSWRDRVAAVTFMRRLQRMRYRTAPGQTVDMLLDQHRQPPALRRLLWEPLCVAALNTPSRIADAQVFLAVLREGLDGPTGSSDLLLPTTDLSKLFPEPAADYVAARGGTIRTGTPVRGLRPLADRFTVATATGHEDFAAVIVAVDAPRVGTVLGNIDALRPVVDAAARLDHGPIASVYLQYPPETTLPLPMIGLDDGPAQWVFDRGRLVGQHGMLGAVTSSSSDLDPLTTQALAQRVHAQLSAVFGIRTSPGWHRVITEKRAAFVCAPGIVRPSVRTAIPGIALAGDYVASEYPATLEAAVRSGAAAAQVTLEFLR